MSSSARRRIQKIPEHGCQTGDYVCERNRVKRETELRVEGEPIGVAENTYSIRTLA